MSPADSMAPSDKRGEISPLSFNGGKVIEKIEPKLGDPIPEDWVKQAEREIKSRFRSFTLEKFKGQDNVELHIWHPTTADESYSSLIYSKAYNRLLRDPDMLSKSQLLEILKERGVWGDKQEKELEQLREDLEAIQLEVAHYRTKIKKIDKKYLDTLKKKWYDTKDKIQNKISERESLLNSSIESRAEEEQLKAKLSRCVKYPDGRCVWESYEVLDSDHDRNDVIAVINDALLFWVGLTQEIVSDLPARLVFGGEENDQEISAKS